MDLNYVYATIALLVAYFAIQVLSGRFDPFAPVGLFLIGYAQVYVVQALSYHDWAVAARGSELVTAANLRSLWALALFLAVYHCGVPKVIASGLPAPPARWSSVWVCAIAPVLLVWGLFCAFMCIRSQTGNDSGTLSPEEALLRSFPTVMLVAADLLIVTGRHGGRTRPAFFWSGMGLAVVYVLLWIFNGRRSPALMGLLSASCAYYISKLKRPSWPVLISIAGTGALLVALALGWRYKQAQYSHDASGFLQFVGDFNPSFVLECLNVKDAGEGDGITGSKETEEYGGYLLMLDTVPEKSEYDHGAPYLRMVSTFIPRIVWPDKPYYGREQWIKAWQAGSELKREDTFTGPAISLLGAAQLNGGAWATAVVVSCLALGLRLCYDFFLRHQGNTWIQAWWALTYYNAWFMVVCDDPMTWFYYVWGFTALPVLALLWIVNRSSGGASRVEGAPTEAERSPVHAYV